jgi:hypothetical protein
VRAARADAADAADAAATVAELAAAHEHAGRGGTLTHFISLNSSVLSPATTEATSEMPQLSLK